MDCFEEPIRKPRKTSRFAAKSTEQNLPHDSKQDEELCYRGTRCQCQDGPFLLGDSPNKTDGSDFYDVCPCNHSKCLGCDLTVQGPEHSNLSPRNLLEELRTEIEASRDRQSLPHIWRCCKCQGGPYHIEEEADLDDYNIPQHCILSDCYHVRCPLCVVSIVPPSIPETLLKRWPAGETKIIITDTVPVCQPNEPVQSDGLAWSERQLSVFVDMYPEESNIFDPNYNHKQRIDLFDQRAFSCDPDTPAATTATTISAEGSPEPSAECVKEPVQYEMDIEEKIKVKKSDCSLRLFSILNKRTGESERPGDETKNSKDQNLAESTDDLYPGIRDPEDFILVWQQAVLPFLATLAKSWFGDEYTIGLRRSKSPGMRTINIMTTNEVPGMQKTLVIQHTRDILPRTFHKSTEFNFHTGSVSRLGVGKVHQSIRLDPICEPKNPYVFQLPVMGDSVGLAMNQGDDHSTSTLGSCILLGETPYWLLSCHPFEKALGDPQVRLRHLAIEHPSPDDRSLCHNAGHKFHYESGHSFHIGKLTQISGPDKSTTRISCSPYWKLAGLEAPYVIMDWAICTAKSAQINIVRLPVSKDYPVQTVYSTRNMNEESAGATVYSVGRTSGFCQGRIGLSPELVSTKVTGARTETMEWFVEEPYPYDNEEGWIESGIGISGDSGAAILDQETNHLYGHLWGRNEYRAGRRTPRVTYFTPIDDIFDDIEEKFSGAMRPRLPQLSEASTPLPSAPMCQQCRLLDPVWIETLFALPEVETSGMDITREERDDYNGMTPMRDLMRSVEMTPQEDEILTPEDIRSPELQQERMILLKHTGLSCQSSYNELSKRGTDMPYTGLLEISDAELAASFPCDLLDIASDEFEAMPSGVGPEVKRRFTVEEVNGEVTRVKKQKVA